MVTAKRYIDAFNSSMTKRFKWIKELTSAKRKIDRKVERGESLSQKEISQLIEIIGRDWFRRAEKRKKQSLRHAVYKVLKSLRNFQNLAPNILKETEATSIFPGYENWRGLLDEDVSKAIVFLESLDKVYEKEAECLIEIQEDKKNQEEYKPLLTKEESLFFGYRQNAYNIFSKIMHFIGEPIHEIKGKLRVEKFNAIVFGFLATNSIALLYLSLAFANPDIAMEPYSSIKLAHVMAIFGLLTALAYTHITKESIKEIYKYSKFLGIFEN